MDWQHIFPIEDIKEHDTETLNCSCMPKIDWDNNLVIHNSWDLREYKEGD